MTRDEAIEMLCECEHEIMFADGYDDCIMGIFHGAFDRPAGVVYDMGMIIDKLALEMPVEEAAEFFYYNIEGAYVGEGTPIFVEVW